MIACHDEHDKIKIDFTIIEIEDQLNRLFDVYYLTTREMEHRLAHQDLLITTFLDEGAFLCGDRPRYNDYQNHFEHHVSRASITFNQNMSLELLDNAILCFRSVKFYRRWSTGVGYPSSNRLYHLIIDDETPDSETPQTFLKEIKHYHLESLRNLYLATSYLYGVTEMQRTRRVVTFTELLKEEKYHLLLELAHLKTRVKQTTLPDVRTLRPYFDRVLTEFQTYYQHNSR